MWVVGHPHLAQMGGSFGFFQSFFLKKKKKKCSSDVSIDVATYMASET